MAEPFYCTIASPHEELFSGQIYYANIPGSDGGFGVLKGHETLVTINGQGLLKIHMDEEGNDVRTFLVYHGVTSTTGRILSVAARYGLETVNIDPEVSKRRAERFRNQIEELKEGEDTQSQAVRDTIQERLNWYELQLKYLDGEVK